MADVFSKQKRSQIMAAIRPKGNKTTELRLAQIFREAEIKGWRRQQPVEGKPDFVFRRARLAVFVDGCFWHGCKTHCRMPKSRVAFWREKIRGNKARDIKVAARLRKAGWRVARVWEHSLRNPLKIAERVLRLLNPATKVP